MESDRRLIGPPEWLILVGGSVFVLVLAISAYWEKDIRWLHLFQAWMYIAAMAFSIAVIAGDISSECLRQGCGIT